MSGFFLMQQYENEYIQQQILMFTFIRHFPENPLNIHRYKEYRDKKYHYILLPSGESTRVITIEEVMAAEEIEV